MLVTRSQVFVAEPLKRINIDLSLLPSSTGEGYFVACLRSLDTYTLTAWQLSF